MTLNNNPYLRTQRDFPHDDPQGLGVELDRSYVDIAQQVNSRTIGIYALNFALINGESWYLKGSNQKQQALREVYTFTATGNIAHGIPAPFPQFTNKCYGSFTDGTNSYGAIYASNVAIAGQVTFYITPTNIVVLAGAGAPSITSGLIVLEWLSQV